ncbi:hypothetical protein AVEN_72189-1 [Araneus ventricosus]|uniref:Uncharacterized protein n=1 Tax=Araneus ventricosus TaxID=182803 RepID=A0A4Y2EKD1_ARAVE|nr:hypothetical protein AVEN_72189-1 [Araneus ventricosus]
MPPSKLRGTARHAMLELHAVTRSERVSALSSKLSAFPQWWRRCGKIHGYDSLPLLNVKIVKGVDGKQEACRSELGSLDDLPEDGERSS